MTSGSSRTTPAPAGPAPAPARPARAAVHATRAAWAVAALVVVLLLAVVVRLPWAGDLGMHAATVERLRQDLTDPGDPLVDADAPSPYYSPWTVLLGCVARLTGLSAFVVLRLGALVGLTLLVTGVTRYVRTLSAHRAAPPLAVLSLLLLWGTARFAWSGFLGLDSLALTVSYPSVFALGLAFHFWAWLTRTARDGGAREPWGAWGTWAGLGGLWAVIVLCHQFTGIVASLGALATLLAARPVAGGAGRGARARPVAGVAVGLVVLWLWPYYDVFALFAEGDGLQRVHRPLYRDLPARHWLVLLGVAALAARWRRDHRDPLALFFALGVLVFAAGGLTGHYAWGRALPAALIPAQLAAALAAAGPAWRSAPGPAGVTAPGQEGGRSASGWWAAGLAAALAVGAWAQAGALGYVVPRGALPRPVEAKYRQPWPGYHWITRWVRPGDVVMARTFPARQIPAYGAYTVAPGYPDFFLPDEAARQEAVRRFFGPGTTAGERTAVVRTYGVRWVVDHPDTLPAAARTGLGLREVARGPDGQTLYAVG